jgi:hypothetical protein
MWVKKNDPDGFITADSSQSNNSNISSNSDSTALTARPSFPDILAVGIELTEYNEEFKPDGVCGRHRKSKERGPVRPA